ncbi:decarboxylase [Mycobacterium tuberculosis]|nr:decarboxylase [Mycobacterium tuberculosis]
MRVWKHVEAAVDSPDRCGVVLVGPHGVGKTLLAQLAAEQVMSEDGRSGRARWVVGTAPGRAIPFGAFRHLISLPASGADIGRPAALLRAARSSLTGDAGDLLLVVDDAHNLDPLSATLVYQLARAGAARLVVTVASEAEPPDAIAALWSDDLLTRVAIEPLDRAQTAAFVESALDATLDVADADELIVTDTVWERKQIMEDRSDAFIVLPGGVGTLDELFDAWTDGYLGTHDKPIVMVDPWGHFDGLRAWLNGLLDTGYVSPTAMERLVVVDNVKDALRACAPS